MWCLPRGWPVAAAHLSLCHLLQEAHQANVKLRETEAKIQRAKEAKEKAERERSEKKSQKRAIEAMMEGGDKEGVMDSLLEALQSGSAFSREGRKKRPARPAGGAPGRSCWALGRRNGRPLWDGDGEPSGP